MFVLWSEEMFEAFLLLLISYLRLYNQAAQSVDSDHVVLIEASFVL